jgi:hypothetical protein
MRLNMMYSSVSRIGFRGLVLQAYSANMKNLPERVTIAVLDEPPYADISTG